MANNNNNIMYTTCFNAQKFNYVSFNVSMTPCGSHVYTNPDMEIISPSVNGLDLGIYMSGDCTFNYHISSLSKKCANLSGWILRYLLIVIYFTRINSSMPWLILFEF